ncbi:TetR/AcrR family transcriptional regulator [Nocardiopsis sp. LOL_012]|uniref:TetR/AcrR family transcriptional regulator n=1 Tax=Nocardiopsis sp. LOL_012 TaxID=3345409 RepID=UPI003A88D8A3
MSTDPDGAPRRDPLSEEAVLRTAVAMADESGAGVPSMRGLAKRLGVEAMSLYHHVRNKEAVLDGMVDLVFDEIELPPEGADWQEAMWRRAASVHGALLRHRWAVGLMDSRTSPGPATLRHHDAVIGCLRSNGFSTAGAAHALSVLDGYVYGFTLQELSLPFASPEEFEDVAGSMAQRVSREEFPHLAEMIADRAVGYDYSEEFGIGLDLILDGLSRRREHWR